MSNKFFINNVAKLLSEKTGKKTAEAETFLKELSLLFNESIVKSNSVKIKGIGAFKITLVKERESVHVNTGERIVIPPHNKLSYIPEKKLRDTINKPFALFESIETQEDGGDVMTLSVVEEETVSEIIDDTSVEENDSLINVASSDIIEYPDETVKKELEEEVKKEIVENIVYSEPPIPSFKKEIDEPSQEETPVQASYTTPPLPSTPPAHSSQKPIKKGGKKSDTSSTKILYFIFFFLLFILIGGGIWYYFFHDNTMSVYYEERLNSRISMENSAVLSDSSVLITEDINVASDTTTNIQSEINTIDSSNAASSGRDSEPASGPVVSSTTTATTTPSTASVSQRTSTSQTNTSSSSNNVLATVKIEPGQRLTLIAEKYYGQKVFWVYIYEYNKTKIGSNPNLLKTGMEVLVPAKELYGIDAQNAASIDKATAIQSQIMEGL